MSPTPQANYVVKTYASLPVARPLGVSASNSTAVR